MQQEEGLNRRDFISVGGMALALAAVPCLRAVYAEPPTPYRALYDERFEAGLAFSAEAARRGWVTRAIRGDITQVWFRELAPRWREGPAAVAGVTTPQTLFVLERLAWDVGLRVTSRVVMAPASLIQWTIGLPQANRT